MARNRRWLSGVCLALGLTALAAGPAAADQDQDSGSYGYLRVVEGSATVMQAGSGARTPADVNQPVLVGDRLWVPEGSKLELVLADRNLVRLDGGSELLLANLAASPDADDEATVLRLMEGNMVVVVTDDSLGDELPRLETPNATIFPQDFGTYRVTTDRGSWTEVTVRRGKAEVEGGGETETVRADESATIEGDSEGEDRSASIDVGDASGFDGLERWAQRLDDDARADLRYVDDDLRYSAAPLNRYGSWVTVENEAYWRPQVAADWRPYWHGRWAYTPSGMTWVSYEPWGWVPYHYGSWDFVSGHGWLWRPGYVYSPAWVYWYWGPSYTGWCPIGYYTHYYSARYRPGFRGGVYGWAGGDWGLFANWSFVSSSYFRGYRDGYRNGRWDGRRDNWREHWDVRRYAVPVDQLRRGGRPLDRGIITTDTRALTPETFGDPRRAVEVLSHEPARRGGGRGDGALPDVTPFVARRPELPPTVAQTVVSDGRGRLDGTPLRPSTLGRGDHVGRKPRVVREVPGAEPSDGIRGGRVIVGDAPAGSSGGGREGRAGRVDRKPGIVGTIPGDRAQGGAPRPDRGEQGGTSDSGGRAPRMGREVPTVEQGDRQGGRGGAPRPDRGEQGGISDSGGRAPRMGREVPTVEQGDRQGGRGGAPRPGRGERGERGGAPRPRPGIIQPIPGGQDREIPPHRQGVERPTYQRVDPPPSRSYGDDSERGARSRGAYERPAYDPPRPTTIERPAPERERGRVERPAERSPRVESRPEPRPEPRQAPERSARPSNDRGSERQQQGGRARSSEGGGGRGGRARRGSANDDGGR